MKEHGKSGEHDPLGTKGTQGFWTEAWDKMFDVYAPGD